MQGSRRFWIASGGCFAFSSLLFAGLCQLPPNIVFHPLPDELHAAGVHPGHRPHVRRAVRAEVVLLHHAEIAAVDVALQRQVAFHQHAVTAQELDQVVTPLLRDAEQLRRLAERERIFRVRQPVVGIRLGCQHRVLPAQFAAFKDEQGSLALGATDTETWFKISVPAAKSGIAAGIVLGIGRAIGEAMAVMMVAGNSPNMPDSLFRSVTFLTTAIAKEMSYASGLQKQALFSIALVLFVFIMIINVVLNVVLKGGSRDE